MASSYNGRSCIIDSYMELRTLNEIDQSLFDLDLNLDFGR
jgi:hypothetical protein